jgi:hypothetical protein
VKKKRPVKIKINRPPETLILDGIARGRGDAFSLFLAGGILAGSLNSYKATYVATTKGTPV